MVFLTHSLMFSQDFLFRYKGNPNTNNLLNCMDSSLSKGSLNNYYETNVCPHNNTHQKSSGCFYLPYAHQSIHSQRTRASEHFPQVWPMVPWGPQDSFKETHEVTTISIIIILVIRSGLLPRPQNVLCHNRWIRATGLEIQLPSFEPHIKDTSKSKENK